MHEDRRVRMLMQGLVILNLVVLVGLFLGPRLMYILKNSNMTSAKFLQSPGTFDLPNLYSRSYELAFAVREATPESAIVHLPPANGPYLKDSVLLQVLLPRHLVFSDSGAVTLGDKREKASGSWVVSRPQDRPETCKRSSSLGNTGYVICRIGG